MNNSFYQWVNEEAEIFTANYDKPIESMKPDEITKFITQLFSCFKTSISLNKHINYNDLFIISVKGSDRELYLSVKQVTPGGKARPIDEHRIQQPAHYRKTLFYFKDKGHIVVQLGLYKLANSEPIICAWSIKESNAKDSTPISQQIKIKTISDAIKNGFAQQLRNGEYVCAFRKEYFIYYINRRIMLHEQLIDNREVIIEKTLNDFPITIQTADLHQNPQPPNNNFVFGSDGKLQLNIQPQASILNVFSRLNYKPWYAIAEFVDNSTQSYFSHKAELDSLPNFKNLTIQIEYDQIANTLTIIDNAYGMEEDRFRDAILLDSRNNTQTGRNEFGMGLKTAASWFGNVWSVESTMYGSLNSYKAIVNIPILKEQHLNTIEINRTKTNAESHGTKIIISQITKKLTSSQTISKIKSLLSSMYRRDINKEQILISFNGEVIGFEDYKPLVFKDQVWKKNLDFEVVTLDKKYHVSGFVGIMNPGSFPNAGFALFRHDRVIIGGTDNNYKPHEIFGQVQSQVSLKLYGELNLDDFPVNQAKDNFIWDDGLEEEFIKTLKNNIEDFIVIAEMSKKERADKDDYTPEKSKEVQKEVQKSITPKPVTPEIPALIQPSKDDPVQKFKDTVLKDEPDKEEIVGEKREYTIPIDPMTKLHFVINWSTGKTSYWLDLKNDEQNNLKFNVTINIDHPFFRPYTREKSFQIILEKFVLAFLVSEWQAKIADSDGKIAPDTLRMNMNKYLKQFSEND